MLPTLGKWEWQTVVWSCVVVGSALPLRLSRRLRPLGYPLTWSLLALATVALLAENFDEM